MRRNPSYSQKDLPPRFILALNFSVNIFHGKVDERAPNLAVDLLRGEIKGVKGVTGANPIVAVRIFANIRDMLLLMPTAEFMRLNKVSRVMYENVDYLLSNGMWALKRLFNNLGDKGDGSIVGKMGRYLSEVLPQPARYEFQANAPFQTFGYFIDEHKLRFSSVAELAKGAHNWVHKHNKYGERNSSHYYHESLKKLSVKEWAKYIREGLAEMGGLYRNEQEWLIKGDSIKIPASTTLYVKDYHYRKETEKFMAGDKWAYLIGDGEDHAAELVLFDDLIKRLREKYPVTILPPGKVQKVQERLVRKYGFG